MNLKGCYSRNCDDWATPEPLYNFFISNGYFDPCPLFSFFDGLAIDWGNLNFVNPPYSKLSTWIDKAIEESKKGKTVIMLIPARTETKNFAKLWDYGSSIIFIRKRLKFGGSKTNAPFPSMLVNLIGGGYYEMPIFRNVRNNKNPSKGVGEGRGLMLGLRKI